MPKNKNTKNFNSKSLHHHNNEAMGSSPRETRTKTEKLALTALLGGVMLLAAKTGALDLERGAFSEKQNPQNNTELDERHFDDLLSQRRKEEKVRQREEMDFMNSLQESIDNGSLMPEEGALIVDRGVRVRGHPEIEDRYQDKKVSYVTDSVMVIHRPVIFDNKILIPNDSDGFDFIHKSIVGQYDEKTDNIYAQFVYPNEQSSMEGYNLKRDGNRFSIKNDINNDEQAVGIYHKFDSMEQAMEGAGIRSDD